MTSKQPNPPSQRPQSDDEISLIDVWLVLVNRQKLVFATMACFLAMGLLLAFLRSPVYSYMASIEIGTTMVDGSVQPIERPEALLAKVQSSYIPAALSRLRTEDPTSGDYDARAHIPANSGTIVVEADGRELDSKKIVGLLTSIVGKTLEEHSRLHEKARREIALKRRREENRLASLGDEMKRLKAELARIDSIGAQLKMQIAETSQLLKSSEKRTKEIDTGGPDDQSKAFMLLLTTNEIRSTRESYIRLQEHLYVGLAAERNRFIKALSDNERSLAEQKDMLARMAFEQADIRETRVIVPPERSLKPKGLGELAIIGLALIMGLVVSVVIALVAEFFSKVRIATHSREV